MTSTTTFPKSRINNSVPRQLGAIENPLHSPAHVILPNLQTPFSQYCDMNYAASDSESRQIHHIIADQIAQLVDVESEIERVENLMARLRGFHLQLTDSRNKIQQTINRHQGLISCIRRFPAETLGEIFIHCLPPDPHIQPNPRQAPLLLTRICRSWRQVALATPRLWCSLYVGPSHRVQQQALSFYHTWLSRARSVPLSIAVDTRLVHAPFNPMWRFEVTELLKRYTSRCSCLYVMFDEEASLHAMLRDVPTTAQYCCHPR
ncbi:hypothetical protein BV22DRAFT_1076017 [Leucogyrophana mollusca]|uniref:Uncharacterized protein n=1 Tax=Leucogyrophana mollusca TaxID=85980 RepID=A0ACB8B0P2_9AGAM|nr:hypothetical protein BV22DRAFT_1076017 [Leucogyrophana mollusca]